MPKQSLARNGFTEADVKKALHDPNRWLSFRYDLLDSAGVLKGNITPLVRKGSVRYDESAQIKRTARFEVTDDGTIDFGNDRIRPWVRVRMPSTLKRKALIYRCGSNLKGGAPLPDWTILLLSSLGYVVEDAYFATYDANAQAKLADLNQYALVWCAVQTTTAFDGTLIKAYVDAGGRVLFTGHDWVRGAQAFARTTGGFDYYNGANPSMANSSPWANANPKHPAMAGLPAVIARQYDDLDRATLAAGAEPLLTVADTTGTPQVTAWCWSGGTGGRFIGWGVAAALELTNNAAVMEPLIRSWVRWLRPANTVAYAEFAQGVLLLSTPPKQIQSVGMPFRQIEAYDQMQILLDDAFDTRYVADAGDNVVAEVKSLLASAGIVNVNIPDNPTNLAADRDWPPGVNKAQIIADLLLMINYEPLWFDELGWARSEPYVLPTSKPADYVYSDDAASVLYPEATQTADTFKIPNKWKLVVTEPDLPPMQTVYVNDNPNSPTSTVRRGRTIMAPLKAVLAITQADLDGLGERTAFEASQIYEGVEFTTAIMPFHSHRTVVEFNYSRLVQAKYQETSWEFELAAGAAMKHEARRLIEV